MAWTQFWDMRSGGGQKLEWGQIFIEATEAQAREVFMRLFGRDADNVTCDCCGNDYSVSEYASLAEATDYQRSNSYSATGREPAMSVEEYCARPDVRVVRAAELAAGLS